MLFFLLLFKKAPVELDFGRFRSRLLREPSPLRRSLTPTPFPSKKNKYITLKKKIKFCFKIKESYFNIDNNFNNKNDNSDDNNDNDDDNSKDDSEQSSLGLKTLNLFFKFL